MIIVGGTYGELVTVPADEALVGSGVRAAIALSGEGARLVTAVDPETTALAEVTIAPFQVERTIVGRDQPVNFRYFTPVSPPSIDGPAATHSGVLEAAEDTVLLFGMVESGPRDIHAEELILDPQRPRDLAGLNVTGLTYDALVLVANAREIRALAGGQQDLPAAAAKIMADSGARAVVVKDSGRGCLVLDSTTRSGPVRIGPHPTPRVWPLGSGDVFAAGFAHARQRGADWVEAARVGSNSAAWWCSTRANVVDQRILGGAAINSIAPDCGPELAVPDTPPVVYLAAPFFSLAERWLVETCRNVLTGLGARVFSPLHDVGPGGDEVAVRDLDGLERADAVFALLDGWDPGTVYEVGWAHRHGLPVVGFINGPTHEGTKMLVGSGAEIHSDLSSALYRAVWAAQGHPVSGTRIFPTRTSAP